jgi:hypothetical protein
MWIIMDYHGLSMFQKLTQVVQFASRSVKPTFGATGTAAIVLFVASAASAPGPVARQNE